MKYYNPGKYRTHRLLVSQGGHNFFVEFEALDLDGAMADVRAIYGDVTLIQWGTP